MLPSFTELIKQSVEEYKKQWKTFIKYPLVFILAYVAVVVLLVILVAIVGITTATQLSVSDGLNNVGGLWASFGTSIIIGIVLAIVVALIMAVLFTAIQIAYIRTIDKAMSGGTVQGVFAEIGQSRGIIWRLIGSQLLVGLYTALPYLIGAVLMLFAMPSLFLGGAGQGGALFVIGIVFMVYGFFHATYFGIIYGFTQFEVILKGEKAVPAMRASKQLVKGRWWSIFGRIFVPGLFFVLPYYVLVGLGSVMNNTIGGVMVLLGIVYVLFFLVIIMPILIVKLFRASESTVTPHAPSSPAPTV